MKVLSKLSLAMTLSLCCACCGNRDAADFISVRDGQFVRGDKPYGYYIGTNMWYGPVLASATDAADPDRLAEELDSLKALGITNLRVLLGADGEAGVQSKVEPTLQTAPGVYDENMFVGVDRFLCELGKRGMTAILYLNNAWEWSGGYGQYLEWAGAGSRLNTNTATWDEYRAATSRFITNEKAREMFRNHVRNVVTRVNTVTGKPYSEDPAIFSWQICNEPRCFTDDEEVQKEFASWLKEIAGYIKSLDSNHMVSTGNEGSFGCEMNMDLYRDIHSCPDIDYLTIHIWPYNWGWAKADNLEGTLPEALSRTDRYIDSHIILAEELGKPLVIEEFGFPRDGFRFEKGSPVTCRDKYYSHIFGRLEDSARRGGVLAGLNFWTWGGTASQNPENVYWKKGDDYCGDPAQEQQGLNSIYLDDSSTIGLIRESNARLAATVPDLSGKEASEGLISMLAGAVAEGKTLYGHQDDLFYGHNWKLEGIPADGFTRSDVKESCGSFPAVLGMDLGGIEIGDECNLDGIPFEMMRAAAEEHYARGGVLTFSWHARNPLTGGDAWDITSDKAVEYILKGEGQDKFLGWLERTADFLESVKGPDGKPAAVIFRPWHEHTGSWFWWGRDLCSIRQYQDLWNLTYEYMVCRRGLANLVWAYSPGGGNSEEIYMERYPGDGTVDILGLDLYEYVREGESLDSANARFSAQMRDAFSYISRQAESRSKLAALTEAGLESLGHPAWWTEALLPVLKEYPVAYALTWRNAWDKPMHFYAPYEGFENAGDFRNFVDEGSIVMLDGLKKKGNN